VGRVKKYLQKRLFNPLKNKGKIHGYDLRTIQELLGHKYLQTTMIYTHVASKNILGVRSPLDK
jgi:integrase